MTMRNSDSGPNQDCPNDEDRTDAEILNSSLSSADGHIPVPAGHAPRLNVEQLDAQSSTIRVSERERDGAWIEYEPMEVV